MVTIRKYEEKDKENVQFVCLNSEGPEEAPDEATGRFILITFCNYYLEHEPENCFVVDDDGRAVGYIICAENYDKYKEIFDRDYLPLTEEFGPERYRWALTSSDPQGVVKNEYPAHLHIDILPEYQRLGMGGKLVTALCEHLTEKGIKGVCLTCGPKNERAMNFYKKRGFTLLLLDDEDACFGIKTN